MNVERQNMGACRIKLAVEADVNETRPEYEKVVQTFMQRGKVKGFRTGKVPRDIIHRQFGGEIHEETTNRLMRDLYQQAIEKEGIRVVNIIELEDVKFSPEGGIRFATVLDIEPDFELPKYDKIAIPQDEIEISDEQVEERIATLSRAFAKFENAGEDDTVSQDDLVSIDYSGKIGDKTVKEVCEDATSVAEGSDFWCQAGDVKLLPEVMEALIGMRVNETKEGVVVSFADDSDLVELRGKTAEYTVTLKTHRKLVQPEREQLIEQLRLESEEHMCEEVRNSLKEQAEQELLQRQEQAVVNYLLERADFDLPESEVANVVSNMLDRMAADAHQRGATREDLEKHRDEILANATASAKNSIRLGYILKSIARKENIEFSTDDVSRKIMGMAYQQQIKVEDMLDHIKKNNHLPKVEEQVLLDNTMRFLLDRAKA